MLMKFNLFPRIALIATFSLLLSSQLAYSQSTGESLNPGEAKNHVSFIAFGDAGGGRSPPIPAGSQDV